MYKLNMAEIRIIYQIDNAAFDETPLPETKRILNEITEAMSNGSQGGLIQDINGNGIGAWVIEGGDETYPCVKCGKDATEDYLVPEVGMTCDGCMTDADLEAWHAHNKLHNPESYDEEEPWTGDAYNPSEDEEFGFGRNDGPRDDN
jgi:hypothetical protein